ncbi:ParA family protein [Dactylosporangium sucinum]|uniref:Cobyrinic acid a,c-diamide synthase n=1 Tax=Dactylosporangium sucinum TaxID=1424081 RepID=A0A917TX01_9ACTN|nr:ParA family protein [Dactylosporangium sucinum]GGM42144.1 cobyrinic acid a,c-diamide synthase [Dactylosporangium sucinum]
MSVVSVINYKGGVGKTTLTANIGAELAARGRKVLLVDLDPQASLTFSFYRPQDFTEEKLTILQWFQGFINQRAEPLHRFVLTPREINAVVQPRGGQVHLLPAHLGLIEVDLDLAAMLGGARFLKQHPRYLPVHRALADALLDQEFAGYDSVLIDCAPNFNMVTRTAIVASDHVIVPARPDYLSTLGIDYLRARLTGLIEEYNSIAPDQINPELIGVVYTMVQWASNGQWLTSQRDSVTNTTEIEIPVFRQSMRDNKTAVTAAGASSLPIVLAPPGNTTIETLRYELQQLTSEFLARTRI